MKIALVCEYFPKSSERQMRGGVEARTYFIAKQLAKRHDVTVYAVLEPGLEKDSGFDGMMVVRVGPAIEYSQASSLPKRLAYMRNAAKAVASGGFDVVDGCSVTGYPPAWWSASKTRVATYHDVWVGRWIANLGLKGVLGEVMERYVLSRGWDRFIAVSEYTKANLVGYGIKPGRITVASNGIDVAGYGKISSKKYEKPTICSIARLVSYKRLSDLIEAAAKVRQDIPDLRVIIIGTGPERDNLEALAKRLKMSDCVEFAGYVERHDDVLAALKSSHVFCLPSVVEGFEISVVEAMALGIPYVASDIPAIREATRGGEGGLLFRPGSTDELALKLTEALGGKVRGGVDFIGEYDWSKTAQKVEQAYASAMQERTRF